MKPMVATTAKSPPQIIDSGLYKALIEENEALREMLFKVSAVGATVMFHNHPKDCDGFTRAFLKGVVSLDHHLEACEVRSIYQDAYDYAAKPSVIEQYNGPHLKVNHD